MASSGGWLIFSFMLVFLVVEFRTSSCSRCERGLENCDELVLARALKKRALRPQNCRFACFGKKKRETSESLKEHIKIPESQRQTVDKVIDEMLQKRIVMKRETDMKSSRPPCQRFTCGGKKRSVKDVVAPESDETTKKMVSKRKASRLGCWRFSSCKKSIGKEAFSSPPIKEVEIKMSQRQKQQQQEDSKSKCFRFGCKKRGLGVAVNEEIQERFPPDQDDTTKTSWCWGNTCKKRNGIQKMLEFGVKKFDEQPNKPMRFDSKPEPRQESLKSMTDAYDGSIAH